MQRIEQQSGMTDAIPLAAVFAADAEKLLPDSTFSATCFSATAEALFIKLTKRGIILVHGEGVLDSVDIFDRLRLYRDALMEYLKFVSSSLYLPARIALRGSPESERLERIESVAVTINRELAEWITILELEDGNLNADDLAGPVRKHNERLSDLKSEENDLARLLQGVLG